MINDLSRGWTESTIRFVIRSVLVATESPPKRKPKEPFGTTINSVACYFNGLGRRGNAKEIPGTVNVKIVDLEVPRSSRGGGTNLQNS